uniref:HisA/hisF family protein n=1 Tax=Schlesneria paludicola TaxID=360056 RepID=A0A7C2NXC1_9PLAN
MMRVLPVIDILDGQVVRGVGGRRDEYRPIVSSLVAGSDPLEVAAALRRVCGPSSLYVADLDAILHRKPHVELYRQLAALGPVLVDAGVQDVTDAMTVADSGAEVIAGLETVPDNSGLRRIVKAVGTDRVVFSVDLRRGRSLGGPGWPNAPLAVAEEVLETGIQRLIVLDLADVGSHTGGSTADLCREIRRRWPTARVIAGGGVRGRDDLACWEQIGVEGVLVASALHEGRITAADISEAAKERGCEGARA